MVRLTVLSVCAVFCLVACNSEPAPVVGDDPNAKAVANTTEPTGEKALARGEGMSAAPTPTGDMRGQ